MEDVIIPKAKWEFDEQVTECFDDMLERSIPQYNLMRDLVFQLSCEFIQHNTDVLDLGSSKGGAVEGLIKKYGAYNHWILTEVSKPMYYSLTKKYEGLIATNTVQVSDTDLRLGLPYCKPSLILSILTIQFTPIDYRQQIISEIYDRLQSGGAFIFVEKILGSNAKITEVLNKDYWDMKTTNGYTQDQIERKKLSLEGVLVPVTAKWNEELLKQAGFNKIDCFWRYLNFAGWIAIK